VNPLSLLPIVGQAVDKILSLIPDPNARAKAEAEYQQAVLQATMQESADNREINKVEAAHTSVFVAGWRPFFGWMSAFCVLYAYLLRPLLMWIVMMYSPEHVARIPEVPMDHVWELIFGMLGIGGLRTIEKCKGKAR
jgi:hypothetical protein